MSLKNYCRDFTHKQYKTQKGKLYYKTGTGSSGHSRSWRRHNSYDSELRGSKCLSQLSHLLSPCKWNHSLKGKFVWRCHSHMHTIQKLRCITRAQHNTRLGSVFWEEHIARHFLEMLPILDTCHICIETYGLRCAISTRLQRLRTQSFPALPSFYESIFAQPTITLR